MSLLSKVTRVKATGRLRKSESKLLNVWVPKEIFPLLDAAVRLLDTDRSKFVRSALREKIAATLHRPDEIRRAP